MIAARKPPPPARIARGLPGTGRVRLLEVAPARYLVVGSAPMDRFGEDGLPALLSDLGWVSRAAIAHEAVVESFLGSEALLPMKPFTIFTSDDRAVQQVRSAWRRIERNLDRLARHVEWGVRMTFDERRATIADAGRAGARTPRSGRDYLLAKRRLRQAATTRLRRARSEAAAAFKTLAASAADAKRRPLAASPAAGGRALVDAAFLVAATDSARFRAAAVRHARTLEPRGLDLQITGPWPPYSFVKDA